MKDKIKFTKAQKEVIGEMLYWSQRKRCLLYGCVYGIPQIDKVPRKECMFCGEPSPEQNDFWSDAIKDIL